MLLRKRFRLLFRALFGIIFCRKQLAVRGPLGSSGRCAVRIWHRILQFIRQVRRLEVHIFAAYAAYFWILAIFPATMLIISILQYTPILPDDLRGLLEKVVPASLQALTDYMIDELFAVDSPAVLSISAVTALWMTSKGVLSLQRGLNRIYAARETRNALRLRLRCLLFTLVGILATVVLLGLHLLSQDLIASLLEGGSALGRLLARLARLKTVLTTVVLTGLFSVMYTVFPNREVRWTASLPGAFVTAVLWIAFSHAFTLYVDRFANYSLYYGSLSVIAMAMLWLYVCIYLFFCGGILNRTLERRRDAKTS